MSNPKINFIFISEVIRSKPKLNPNDILINIKIIREERGIYSRARPTIASLLVFNFKIYIDIKVF